MKTECEGNAEGDVFPLLNRKVVVSKWWLLPRWQKTLPPPFRCHNFGRGSRFPNISFNSFHAAPTVPRLLQQKNNAPRLLFQLESTKSRLAAYLQFVTFLTGTSWTLFPKCGNNQMLKMQRNVNCFATKYSNEHTRGGWLNRTHMRCRCIMKM